MSPHRTCAVFERYNVVDTQDLRAAVRALESLGNEGENQSPTAWEGSGASELPELRGPDPNDTADHPFPSLPTSFERAAHSIPRSS
jgi:hypothetical protein